MTSTFFGLVTGILIAAYLTTQYSEVFNRHLGQLVPLYEETVAGAVQPEPDSTTPQPVATQPVAPQPAAPQPVAPEPAAPQPAAPQPVAPEPAAPLLAASEEASGQANAQPQPTQPIQTAATDSDARDELEQRWAEFAAQADSLRPVGDFRWRQCFTRAAAAHGVSESLLLAVASGESDFEPAARSDKDAIGVMQIRWPATSHHLGILREADLYDPCTNIDAGARYLAELSARFDHNLHRAVAAYNYGPTRIEAGAMPEGARWYSQYIYQHLLRVLDRPHVASSELLPPRPADGPGFEVLISFNQAFRARDYKNYLESQVPGLELAYRSEVSGQHEVILLYQDLAGRQRGLEAIRGTGLLAARLQSDRTISL